jgi:acetyl esterase
MPKAPPRLPATLEHRALKRLCGLSPRAQRRLFGPPPQIDGQVVAPDINVVLAMARRTGEDTLTGALPPREARAYVRRSSKTVSGPNPLPMKELIEFDFPGPASNLRARLYVPFGAPPPPRPMLVHWHGGGWFVGDLETNDSACRFLAAHSGVSVLAPTYRLAPENPYPAAPEDAQAAWRWALALAGELGADPARIGVGGDSAGANMAAGVCIAMRDQGGPMPAMQLLVYPATDAIEERPSRRLFNDGFILTQIDIDICERAYLPRKDLGYEPLASIIRAPDLSGLPPAYIATAGFDPFRDEGEEFGKRMRAEGGKVAIQRHSRLVHTFANLTMVSPSARAAMRDVSGALRMGLWA